MSSATAATFGVGLVHEPKSRVFVLQATMGCLRSVYQAQHTSHIFLSDEDDNLEILDNEPQQNLRISAEELRRAASDNERAEVRVDEPPMKFKLSLPKCSECGCLDAASVGCGVVERSIAMVAATTRFKLFANGPMSGDYFCNACGKDFNPE